MIRLRRFTTEYVESEDRICLRARGEDGEDPLLRLWLTARLLRRLIPVLLQSLEMPDDAHLPQERLELQRFAQAAARARQPVLPPVEHPEGTEPSQPDADWLIRRARVRRAGPALHLVFQGREEEQQALLVLTPQLLRQWLHIVHKHWSRAEWLGHFWPEWVREDDMRTSQALSGPIH